MNETRKFILVTIQFSAILFVTPSMADESIAKKHFRTGVDLYAREDYARAGEEFEKSVSAFPSKMAYFNLANCYLALQKHGEALETIEELKVVFQNQLEDALRQEIERMEILLQSLMAKLVVEVDQSLAQILINGKVRAQSPMLNPLFLDPGEYMIEVTKEGDVSTSKEIKLTKGQKINVTVGLEQEKAALVVHMNPHDAKLSLNGDVLTGYTFKDPISLIPGRYKVTATKPGYQTNEETVFLESGQTVHLKFSLSKQKEVASAEKNATSYDGALAQYDDTFRKSKLSGLFWTSAITTATTGILSGVFFSLAAVKSNDFQEKEKAYNETAGELGALPNDATLVLTDQEELYDGMQSDLDQANLYGKLGISFGVTAAVAGTVAIITALIDVKKRERSSPELFVAQGGMGVSF